MKRICVCGLGKLGCCIAAAFAASDVSVIGLDIDEKKIASLAKFTAPIQEPFLQDYLNMPSVRVSLRTTLSPREAVEQSDACLFVTPTPSMDDGSFNHGYLLEAIANVARAVEEQSKRNYLFVVNSTTVPGFMKEKATALLRRLLGDLPFRLAYKPEFIAIGTVIPDLHYPDLLLIGAEHEEAGAQVEELYREMVIHKKKDKDGHADEICVDVPAKHMTLTEAELTKISLNCAVTMKISFANQVGMVAKRLGADPQRILDALGEDKRIGSRALRYGLPFGGPCFPRDNRMFQYVAANVGERAPIAEATDTINRRMIRKIVEDIPTHGDIGILGLAYKAGTSLTEESAGITWKHMLQSAGRRVKCHDPLAPHTHTLEEVLACPILIVACACPEYEVLNIPKEKFLIDPMCVVKLTWAFLEGSVPVETAQ